ncbi:thiopeptide-type bacteriocin biosynthesis protein [Sphaerisporangium sp. NPDC051017]|uniref:thiopeptide-type bacteriocin biosynthesis protein n=1 Tax=Sphaerisporangium sp. NPDC051017 TaxID=3154636 RepID=UPI00343CB5D5
MDPCPWRQVNVTFPTWTGAEHAALAHLAPLLTVAESEGLVTSWFFIRKAPCWRVRYLPGGDPSHAQSYIHRHLEELRSKQYVEDLKEVVYEPETHAFGGAEGMASAHRLFHLDCRYMLAYLAETECLPGDGHRRELSIVLCSALLRTAGLDWYEQGDVWARVADHRELPHMMPTDRLHSLETDLRRLMSVDTAILTREGAPLASAAGWIQAFAAAGRELADLAANGLLHRGLRAILAHHIIFAWNRFGLPYSPQAVLANTAKAVVFGCEHAAEHKTQQGGQPCTAPADT